MIGFLIQAAMFLSCLATDINVGLDSWVETDNEKEVNSEQDALNDVLEVLKLELHFSYLGSDKSSLGHFLCLSVVAHSYYLG